MADLDTQTNDAIRSAVMRSVSGAARVWVGFSGGLDSTALLHALASAPGLRECTAVHVNHGLSPNADDWQRHCEQVCANLSVQLNVCAAEIRGRNIELAARRARYSIWADLMGPGDLMTTAHHADDVAETRLWQLFTGRAPMGIPSSRPLGAGRIVRPLLEFTRQQLQGFVEATGAHWVEDESNADVGFDRNWIRRELLPSVSARFDGAVGHLAELRWPGLPEVNAGPLAIAGDAADDTLDTLTVRAWLWAYGLVPRESQVREIVRQASARADAQVTVSVGSVSTVRRYRGSLYVVGEIPPKPEQTVRVGEDASLKSGRLTWERAARGLAPGSTMDLRPRRGGEQILSAGMHKALTNVFQSHGVPPWLRDSWPLVYDGDTLAAVCGLIVADDAACEGGFFPRWRSSFVVE